MKATTTSTITEAVLKYRQTRKESDFQSIWEHFEPKIKSIAHMKSQRLPVDYCTLYEVMVDGLLLAIDRYDETKSAFITYFYQRINGKISVLMKKLNRVKRRGQIHTESLTMISDSGQELELQIADPKATVQIDDTHVVLATQTLDSIIGGL